MSVARDESKVLSEVSRDCVVGILRVLRSDNHDAPAWNIVEVLEVLIDAGQFSAARQLAKNIAGLVVGDGRDRLFNGYSTLCELMEFGEQRKCLEVLERLYIEIHNGGHSLADKVRIGLLLARALALCVSVGSLSQRAILRARNILSVELDRLATSGDRELEAQVLTELAKCHLHAPTEDARSAQAMLRLFVDSPRFALVSPTRAFDVKRVLFQAERRLGSQSPGQISEAMLRNESQSLGGVARALAELAIARRQLDIEPANLEKAASIFEANEFLSGAFEARFVLATHAFDRGHNVVADKEWRRALAIAESGGFLHGKLLALLGLFQSAMLGEDSTQAKMWLRTAQTGLISEVALGSAGLNVAAAQQIVGDFAGALTTAKRCEVFFKERSLNGFQAQAANIVGTCEAHAGRWDRARLAWARAVSLDEERFAFVSACERQGLVAQAYLMHDLVVAGHVKPATAKKVKGLLEKAEGSLEPFGELEEAVRVRGKLQAVHAHVCVLCRDHVGALRYLSTARSLFAAVGMHLDVAMTDASTALSMLEIGKTSNPGLAEEAVLHLQRALQFFAAAPESSIRWKLLYYLAAGALLVSQSKSSSKERGRWRDLAVSWAREAERECAQTPSGAADLIATDGSYTDFAPSLTPAAIEDLKGALGLRDRPRKRRESEEGGPLRTDGYLH
jgi:tetratricopeptide (TPR) repeat protein